MLKLTTLSTTFDRLQEEEVWSRNHSYRAPTHSLPNLYQALYLETTSPKPHTQTSSPITNPKPQVVPTRRNPNPIKRITPNQMQERRDKGLCYYCDEKYQLGHRCS